MIRVMKQSYDNAER
jgi:hypothetical protein